MKKIPRNLTSKIFLNIQTARIDNTPVVIITKDDIDDGELISMNGIINITGYLEHSPEIIQEFVIPKTQIMLIQRTPESEN